MTLHIANTDNVTDDATLELAGAGDVTTAVIAGTTYLFVTGFLDNGVSVFAVEPGGTLVNVDNVTDDATLELDGAIRATTAVIAGTTYLFVTGRNDDGVSVFSVAANGTLTNVTNVTDGGALELDGASGITTVVVEGNTNLAVAGSLDNGVTMFSVGAGGTLTNVDNFPDGLAAPLDGATRMTTSAIAGTDRIYMFVTSINDDAVAAFIVDPDGTLTYDGGASDNATLELDVAAAVTAAVIAGTTYLFVAGHGDDGVSVFSVHHEGALTNVDNVTDDATLLLNSPIGLTTAVIGGATYLFVTTNFDNSLTVFSVAADGTLTNVTTVSDNATLELNSAGDPTTAVVDGITYLFVPGQSDNGVSVFSLVDENVSALGDVLWRHADGTVAIAAHELGGVPNNWRDSGNRRLRRRRRRRHPVAPRRRPGRDLGDGERAVSHQPQHRVRVDRLGDRQHRRLRRRRRCRRPVAPPRRRGGDLGDGERRIRRQNHNIAFASTGWEIAGHRATSTPTATATSSGATATARS